MDIEVHRRDLVSFSVYLVPRLWKYMSILFRLETGKQKVNFISCKTEFMNLTVISYRIANTNYEQ